MRELDGRRTVSRVKGRPALERRLRGLTLAVSRFLRCRARTESETRWAQAVLDRLLELLREVE